MTGAEVGPVAEAGRAAADRGSVTAEFAAALPAVVLVLAFCLAGLQVAGQQLRLQDAAAAAARSVARGESAATVIALAERSMGRTAGAVTLATSNPDALVCATLSAQARSPVGHLLGLTLTASSCALAGGG